VYAVFGLVTTIADAHATDDVAVNVSAGSKLAAIGASLACMDVATDATAYYVRPESRAHDGADAPATSGVATVDELPTYPIDSPTRDQVVVLLLVAVENAGHAQPTKRTLIERSLALAPALADFELGHSLLDDAGGTGSGGSDDSPTFADLSTAAKKGAYRRLDRRLDPLVEGGHVTVSESGRHRRVELTPRGRNTLRAFRHKATDAVSLVPDHDLPAWLDAVDPGAVDQF
jgi:DNA-binding transcriptional ArsR family regulator